jgi:hypothetical protein
VVFMPVPPLEEIGDVENGLRLRWDFFELWLRA